jgi:hypothetical protein
VCVFKVPNVMSCRECGAEPRIRNKVWRRTRKVPHTLNHKPNNLEIVIALKEGQSSHGGYGDGDKRGETGRS